MSKGPLDLTTRTLTGLLLVGGLGVAGYFLWRFIKAQKSKEVASTGKSVVVDIPPLKAPKAVKVKK